MLISVVLSVGFNSIAFTDQVQDEFEGQQFLFLMTEGYNQEEGEFQISFTSQYMDRQKLKDGDEIMTKNQWEWTTSVEYGLWDWLEFEVEIPFAHVHKQIIEDGETTNLDETGISDIETGILINLFEEEQDKWWSHTISAGFEVSWPSGRWRKDLGTDQFGWETNLVMSKTTDKWAYHLLGGFGMTNYAREQGESEKSDVEEIKAGGALVYMATDRLDIICELFSEFEKEKCGSGVSHETEFYITPGVGYELFENFEIGLGVPIGLTEESHDWGIMAKIQYEW